MRVRHAVVRATGRRRRREVKWGGARRFPKLIVGSGSVAGSRSRGPTRTEYTRNIMLMRSAGASLAGLVASFIV